MSETTYLSATVIVKDEEPYILEWVCFHLAQGVERFLVIDNVGSRRLHRQLRGLERDGIVRIETFTGYQAPAYDMALAALRGSTRWLAVIDCDEFLFSPSGAPLPEVLRDYEQFPGVGVNWVLYGDSGHQKRPAGLVIENFVERGPLDHRIRYPHLLLGGGDPDDASSYRPMNSHIKSVIQPDLAVRSLGGHHFEYVDGRSAVTENMTPVVGPWSDTVSVSRLRINHYWSKSQEELVRKRRRGEVTDGHRRNPAEGRLRTEATRGIIDTSAMGWAPAVRALMDQHRG